MSVVLRAQEIVSAQLDNLEYPQVLKDSEKELWYFRGTKEAFWEVTLKSCNCPAFKYHHGVDSKGACKHMIALEYLLNNKVIIMDFNKFMEMGLE